MIGLVVAFCSIATPSLCEEHRVPLHGANELTCLMIGQAEAARALRPGWRVARFGCARLAPLPADATPTPARGGGLPLGRGAVPA